MKIYVPDYYKKFSCIADKCQHSCCTGWEIDIDEDTMDFYSSLDSEFGKRIISNINRNDDCSCFRLTKDEKCPFLNKDKLCDIILSLGENAICQICRDHPRFKNFYDNRIEVGLGLCCEEASRLILSQPSPFNLEIIEDDEECNKNSTNDVFFKIRSFAFDILRDRVFTVDERIDLMKIFFEFELPQRTIAEWCDFYLSLEILDSKWKDLLNRLKVSKLNNTPDGFEIYGENLLCYFIYRHFTNVLYDKNISGWLSFAILGYEMVKALSRMECNSFEDIVEYARLYSSEIEYSQENIDAIISLF